MNSRRVFLKNGAFALVSLGFAPSFLARTAFANPIARRPQLIAIFQRGAADGLNMVVPFGEADYYRLRPSIAVARPRGGTDDALDLDGFFGLHPRLGPLEPLWARRELAIVHACGSPDATRSHFDAQDYLETATPGVKSTADGWLNRYLQAKPPRGESAFRAVALGRHLPRALQGDAPAVATSQIAHFGLRGRSAGILASQFEAQYASAGEPLRSLGRSTFEALELMAAANPSRYRPEPGAEYPRSPFGLALMQIAQLIKAGVGLEVAFAEVGGWDTHVGQGGGQGQLATRLNDFARGVAALVADLGDRMADIVVLTMSEFGRAAAENGNRGTDHGHGNAMFVIGGGVQGGRILGRWPGLGRDQLHEQRDLAVTTDFRDVFGEVVVRHMGLAEDAAIFPGYRLDRARFPGLFS